MNSTLTLLGLLGTSSRHGYDLKHSYDTWFGTEKPLAYGQVYAALGRLLRDQLIAIVAEERGAGPDRKRYEITPAGRERVGEWLLTPDAPGWMLQSNLFAKTILALMLGNDAEHVLDLQRAEHRASMRAITQRKLDAPLALVLVCDHELFHIEADLRWIDLTAARLTELRQEVQQWTPSR